MNTRASTVIFALNVIIFFILSLISSYDGKFIYSLICWNLDSGLFSPYQLLTSQFLHSDLIHLGLNMLLFLACADEVEDEIGERKFVIFYLICGIFATILHIAFSNFPVIGASGAIWGIFVMWAVLKPGKVIEFKLFNLNLSLRLIVFLLFLLEVYLLFFDKKSNVSNLSHIGGALTGLVLITFNNILQKRLSN